MGPSPNIYTQTRKERINAARKQYEMEMVATEVATLLKDYPCEDLHRIQSRVKELLGVTL